MCVCVCVCVCVHVCMRACVRACMCVCVWCEYSVQVSVCVVHVMYYYSTATVNFLQNLSWCEQTKDTSFPEAVRQTIAVNYHGLLRVTNTFLPLLQPNSR